MVLVAVEAEVEAGVVVEAEAGVVAFGVWDRWGMALSMVSPILDVNLW